VALRHVVGGWNVPPGHEEEQMRPVGEYAFAELMARRSNRDRRDDAIESAVEVVRILRPGRVFQHLSSSSDGDGAWQKPPERCVKRCIAIFDGIFRAAQQMHLADLPSDSVPCWLPSMPETQSSGRIAPNNAVPPCCGWI
jgi:hypothetical protein